MSRIRLQLPDYFSFYTTIPIRITDLNYGGHVGNDTVLSLIHESRIQFLKSFGYTEMELEGISLIMSDASIEFKTEVFYGEVLTVFIKADNFGRSGFEIFYKLVNEKNIVVAIAKTGMVCFNYNTRKVVSMPQKVRSKLAV